MTYIYDILLNLSDSNYYEIYEWESKDNIVNIKKAPVFRITSKDLCYLINYRIKMDNRFLNMIKDKNIISKKYLQSYVVILSDGIKSIGIVFNNKGFVIYRSSLMFDEEKEINKIAMNTKTYKLSYKILNRVYNDYLRKDIKKINYIKECIKKDYKKGKHQLLQYLYYDIFNKNDKKIDVIYNRLLKVDSYQNSINKVYCFFKYNNKLIEK